MTTGITIETEGGLITAVWVTHADMEIEIIDDDTKEDDDVPEDELAEYQQKVACLEQQIKPARECRYIEGGAHEDHENRTRHHSET